MRTGEKLTQMATDHPRLVAIVAAGVTVVLALLAALPSLWPDAFPMLASLKVDTDPENMLSRNEAVRVFHNEMKQVFGLNDIVVVGVVNEQHPDGVFNPDSLGRIYALTKYATTLRGDAIGQADPNAGVIPMDVLAPSEVDIIDQAGPNKIAFNWLMAAPPQTQEAALEVRDRAQRFPFLNGTLVSEDGKAIALYIPLTSKDLSYEVYSRLRAYVAAFEGDERYHITGLPVANDVFGVEMFVQMAVSAPLAMLVIFLLLLAFFRKLVLIVSPMILAVMSVVCTMALLVISGNTIHIMSSMIPIFIMPIAVLDSIHILSEFFDRYQKTKDRRKTISGVMDSLFVPMLYTSLTSAAGFASLALTPIPPVQIFGIFVALGVMLAWILTVTFIPAYVMFIPDKRLANFGARSATVEHKTLLGGFLRGAGKFTYTRAKLVLTLGLVCVIVAGYGITRITINDNPTKWFKPSHPIREADRVLNKHFGGTYMAYLSLRPEDLDADAAGPASRPPEASAEAAALPSGGGGPSVEPALPEGLFDPALPEGLGSEPALPSGLDPEPAEPALPAGLGGVEAPGETPSLEADALPEIFKQPDVLQYVCGLQDALLGGGVVGKSNSVADIVKTVHRELKGGVRAEYRLPDTAAGVAQCLAQYQSSHRPNHLWHFVTADYRQASVWVQLKSGDNKDMEKVIETVDDYVAQHPLPHGLAHQWFGLTYINVKWQDKMVSGMLQAFLGSFLVVLLMMIILFRSGLWGLLSMIPLTVTIGLIYGVIGLVGKDYDMPVAVLSSLTLGLAVDFAIHFLARARELYQEHGSWAATHPHIFGEPARAITRNVIVIAVGFLPLLAAPLVPYNTVGFFLASILLVSGAGTLLLLPSLVRFLEPLLFPKTRLCCVTCQCGTCIVTAVTAVALAALSIKQFLTVGWTTLTWISLAVVPVLALGCGILSRREKCRVQARQ
ncbi:MAG TPA: MMPL family transporter [Candidatus Hydrogenedentes bacterium]|nr:MMPL family transporter [Candidatus Hydrogenedentota bacterium]